MLTTPSLSVTNNASLRSLIQQEAATAVSSIDEPPISHNAFAPLEIPSNHSKDFAETVALVSAVLVLTRHQQLQSQPYDQVPTCFYCDIPGHTFRFFRKRKPEHGFTVNVIALTLPTTIRCTTKAIVVSYKLRMTIQLCGLRTTNMLRASLDVAHCHCILAILRRVEAPTVSSVLHAQETSKHSSWRLDCGHRNDKENSKCTTQPNNGYLRRISHSFTCRYRFIHFRTFVGSL